MTIRLYGTLDKHIPLDPSITLESLLSQQWSAADLLPEEEEHPYYSTVMPFNYPSITMPSTGYGYASSGNAAILSSTKLKPAVMPSTALRSLAKFSNRKPFSPVYNSVYHVSIGEFLDGQNYTVSLSPPVTTQQHTMQKYIDPNMITMRSRSYKPFLKKEILEKITIEVAKAINDFTKQQQEQINNYQSIISKIATTTTPSTTYNTDIVASSTATYKVSANANEIKDAFNTYAAGGKKKKKTKRQAKDEYLEAVSAANATTATTTNNLHVSNIATATSNKITLSNGPFLTPSGVVTVSDLIQSIYDKPEYNCAEAYEVQAYMEYVDGYGKPTVNSFIKSAGSNQSFARFRALPRGLRICYLDFLDQKDAMDKAFAAANISYAVKK